MTTIPGNSSKTAYFQQDDFSGGMRRNVEPFRLATNEYALLQNGRSRYGNIRTIRSPKDLTGEMPSGNMQGLYGYGKYLVAFVNGVAFVRDYSIIDSQFNLVPDFQLDANVETIYTEAVEASWQNYQRLLVDEEDASSGVRLLTSVTGTPSCLVCQDGISRPRLIFPDGASRVAQNFGQWTNTTDMDSDTREYVPIGSQMVNHDGVLYIVSGDKIYRSVTGRPLDFVVAVDINGDKLTPLAGSTEEASRLHYAVDFNPITCIASLPSGSNSSEEGPPLYVGTSQSSYMVFPLYNDTIYGEPKFRKQLLFPTGPLNQFSLVDLLGNTAIVDAAGMVSFNSVLQVRNEGRNAPFHDEIHDLFDGITQSITAAYEFDNYGLFAVDTVFGPGILVYDELRQKWASFDQYPDVIGYIVQFAEVKVNGRKRMFFRTSTDQVFEAYAGDDTATVGMYTREMTMLEQPEMDILPKRLRLTFDRVVEDGTLTATDYVDRVAGEARTKVVVASSAPQSLPITPPFGPAASEEKTKVIPMPLELSRQGDKCGFWLEWNYQGDLNKLAVVVDSANQVVPDDEQGDIYTENIGAT